jgi:hypothetical protein
MKKYLTLFAVLIMFVACKKTKSIITPPVTTPNAFHDSILVVNGTTTIATNFANLNLQPTVQVTFSTPIDTSTASAGISLTGSNASAPLKFSYTANNSTIIIQPATALHGLIKYQLSFTNALLSAQKVVLSPVFNLTFTTQIDSTNKFPAITDSALLTLVQQQTLKYFYDFGHPVSGMARERTSSGDIVTTGGTGFGVMAMIAGINRNFITRSQGLQRVSTIVNFLTGKCTRYHGAFSHWINGATGATVPFSQYDDGGDLVETSFLLQGLLSARQYFNTADPGEVSLRSSIDSIYNAVEWNWYRQGGQNALFWHWSPDYGFKINQQISGWDEALMVYVLAASSNIDSNTIPKVVYDNGWALNGNMKNGKSFYGIQLPLGPDYGGPLFFAHYSFLGINPQNLTDAYANYWQQDTAHAAINYTYCVNNPNRYNGYSSACWGLTASDIQNGYTASSPTNDVGVIAPTAAVSSLPYTPAQSMNALRFFYYQLGDKIWSQYGFIDAFNLSTLWYDTDCLAIDQGPEIVMIENYRTGLLWNLFMSCPEVKRGMHALGFQSPNL